MESVLKTQMFQGFVYERQENPDDPEVRFFDESILAKENRSKKVKFRGGKKATEFLNDSTGQVSIVIDCKSLKVFLPRTYLTGWACIWNA